MFSFEQKLKKYVIFLPLLYILIFNPGICFGVNVKNSSSETTAFKENIMLLYNMGSASIKIKNYDTAVIYLEKVLELDPKYIRAYADIGRAYSRNGNCTKSLEILKKAIVIEPKNAQVHLNMAETLNRMHRETEAIEECKKAIDINSRSLPAWGVLGVIYFYQTGTVSDSILITTLEKYSDIKEENDRMMVKEFGMQFISDEANFAYAENCWFLAQVYFRNKNYKKVLVSLDKTGAFYFFEPDYYFMAGISYHNMGDNSSALENLLKAKSQYEKQDYFHGELGGIYLGRREYDKAIEEYIRAININPNNLSYFYNLACAYAKKNDAYSSIKWLKKAIDTYPKFRQDAKIDKDFNMIRNSKEFKNLIEDKK